ncbi:MAG: peptidoglycan-binding protein [Clostridiales bacterium]|nr:peptidoglycan-binding protein [Clostridiales bacterium]
MKRTWRAAALACAALLALGTMVHATAPDAEPAPPAYVGLANQIYLLELENPLPGAVADQIIWQDDEWVYYQRGQELYRTSKSGGEPTPVTDAVAGDAVAIEADGQLYYLDAADRSKLMAVPFGDVAPLLALQLAGADGALVRSMDGLRYVERGPNGDAIYLYRPDAGGLIPANGDPTADYRNFDLFETELTAEGLQLRLKDSDEWLTVAGPDAGHQVAIGGLLYYTLPGEDGPDVRAFDPALGAGTHVAALAGKYADAAATIDGRLYLVTSAGDVVELDPATGQSRSFWQPLEPLAAPRLVAVGGVLLVFDEPDGERTLIEALQAATPKPTPRPTPAYTALKKGDRGDAVRALQRRLLELDYPVGSPDGVYGMNTYDAVRYFQQALGQEETGAADVGLQRALFARSAPGYEEYAALSRGDRGIRVEKLQARLRSLGYLAAPVDGQYGSRTLAAVKLFQQTAGLRDTGSASATTLKKLFTRNAPECEDYIALQRGDTGVRVRELNARLKALGYLKSVSSSYGSATQAAVKQFQKAIGADQTGQAGVALLKKLFASDAPPVPQPTATPKPTETPEPTETPDPTATTEPTATAEPTATPKPTATPAPTATPDPGEPAVGAEVVALLHSLLTAQPDYAAYTEAQAVEWMQLKLKEQGCLPADYTPTRVYDRATRDALAQYQADEELSPADGILTQETFEKLFG